MLNEKFIAQYQFGEISYLNNGALNYEIFSFDIIMVYVIEQITLVKVMDEYILLSTYI